MSNLMSLLGFLVTLKFNGGLRWEERGHALPMDPPEYVTFKSETYHVPVYKINQDVASRLFLQDVQDFFTITTLHTICLCF